MNFEIFLFLLFMSFVSFAVGVIVWVAIMRFFGQGSRNARILSYILIPIFALGYNFLVLTAGKWRYLVGFIPIALIIGYALYYRFGNHGTYIEPQAKPESDFQRRESSKSRRIREAREKRAAERELRRHGKRNRKLTAPQKKSRSRRSFQADSFRRFCLIHRNKERRDEHV